MKKCLVVYNPNSGKYNKEVTLPKIEKILNEYPIDRSKVINVYYMRNQTRYIQR